MNFREFITRHSVRIGLSLAVLIILLLNTCEVINVDFIKRMENFSYDVRLNLMMPDKEDKATMDELEFCREAIQLYRAQNWDLAELHFVNLQKMSPQRFLYEMYIERVVYFRQNPPGEGWDGVFTHRRK